MTRILYASTLFGAMSLAAAADAGLLGGRDERRMLIVSDNTAVPEIGEGLDRRVAFEPLRDRFDDIVRWNDLVAPMHPSGWTPPAAEVPMLSRLIVDRLGIHDGVDGLVLESVAVAPARAIGTLIRDCPVTVYSDGLMSYGPTRDELAVDIGRRVDRMLHLDLVPAVRPLLLREYDVQFEHIPDDAFVKIVGELAAPVPDDVLGCPVIVGQYLAPLQILTGREEEALYAQMVAALAKAGHQHVVFKPHPAGGRVHLPGVRAAAERAGVRLSVIDDGLPVEAWLAQARPQLVVSCFSTALLTAARYFELPTATMGAELALERITPYQNSNRIPATIVDASVPRLRPDGTLADPPAVDLDRLVRAVGYCMQPGRMPELRAAAVEHVRTNGPDRWFKQRRLQSLDLVPAPVHRSPAVRRAARRARRGAERLRCAVAALTSPPGR